MESRLTQRAFLSAAAGAAVAGTAGAAFGATCPRSPRASAGPFWKRGAPRRVALTSDGGRPLRIEGRLVAAGSCAPLSDALIDVWQANPRGEYDERGFSLRAKFRTDGDGRFELRTVWPGRYRTVGERLRPAHIHLFARRRGHRSLTTQLYFEGDPHLEGDSLVHPRLVGAVDRVGGVDRARYQLVL